MTKMKNKLFKIGDIIEKLKLTPRTIRYYDQLGLLPTIKRSDGQTRLFDTEDIKILRKINDLKKTSSLSLTEIKNKLYPTKLSPKKDTIITDSLTYNSLKKDPVLCVVDISTADISKSGITKEFIKNYKKTLSTSTTKFAIHQISPLFTLPSEIKAELKKKKITLIEIPLQGLLAGVMIDLILEFINKSKSLEETLIAIKQHQPLLSSYGLTSNLGFHYDSNKKENLPHSFINHLNSFIPIFKQTTTQNITFIRCEQTKEQAQTVLFNKVLEKMEERQHYAFQITIYDSYLDTDGKELQSALTKYYSNTTIKHVKINSINQTIFGQNSMLISII